MPARLQVPDITDLKEVAIKHGFVTPEDKIVAEYIDKLPKRRAKLVTLMLADAGRTAFVDLAQRAGYTKGTAPVLKKAIKGSLGPAFQAIGFTVYDIVSKYQELLNAEKLIPVYNKNLERIQIVRVPDYPTQQQALKNLTALSGYIAPIKFETKGKMVHSLEGASVEAVTAMRERQRLLRKSTQEIPVDCEVVSNESG